MSLLLSGTAFAVTKKRIVTCYHNIDIESTETTLGSYHGSCVLIQSVDKAYIRRSLSGWIYDLPASETSVEVQFSSGNELDDWVVYERSDEESFDTFFRVCDEQSLPLPSPTSHLTSLFAPLGFLDEEAVTEIQIWRQSSELVQYQRKRNIRNSVMFLKDGKCRSSSGSPVINKGGYVVGFHTDSFNEPTVPIPKEDDESVPERMEGKGPAPPAPPPKKLRLTVKALENNNAVALAAFKSDLMDIGERVRSVSSNPSHSDYSLATVICKLPDLMAAINS